MNKIFIEELFWEAEHLSSKNSILKHNSKYFIQRWLYQK